MVMQDIITQAKYRLPVINVVFSNDSFGFIEAEQEDAGQTKFGVDLQGADYAKAGEAMGAKGFSITKREQLAAAFDEAKKSTVPVVIDVKIENKRPFPAEAMMLDKDKYGAAEIDAFKERYEVGDMPLLKELLK
jgi:Thiamine pyrophosphate-requiring enzymes [acetolactate synthase, pyruvate dehydrogenase (cytochrome), glyoxylate carboligase, phosphonopyruvate decarboxylase]